MKRKNSILAQSILEYAVVMIVVVAALVAMFGFLKRHFQAGWRESADSFGQGRQYEENVTIIN